MKKYCIVLFLLFYILVQSKINAQSDSTEFKPSGRVIARAFIDYSNDFKKTSGFDITRAFLGYQFQINPTLSGQVILDGAAGTKENKLEVYLRNAFLRWEDKGFDIHFGMIGLLQFSIQEKYWRYRYVLRSFQDLNKMAPSVDLGVTAAYKLNGWLSADLSLTNGSGYKDVRKSDSKRYGGGISIHPASNWILRIYGDLYNESEDLRGKLPEEAGKIVFKNQYSLALFSGYMNKRMAAGIEFNRVFNSGFIEKKDLYGYSVYGSMNIGDKWSAFIRYDLVKSTKPSSFVNEWSSLDGQLMIAGAEYRPMKQLKISPNLRNINPDREGAKQYLFINLEFNW